MMRLGAGVIPPSHNRSDTFSERELWTASFGELTCKGSSAVSALEQLAKTIKLIEVADKPYD